jgi:hypothetical protein
MLTTNHPALTKVQDRPDYLNSGEHIIVHIHVGFAVLTAVVIKNSIPRDITPCRQQAELLASCWFLASLILQHWRWRRNVPQKRTAWSYIPEHRTLQHSMHTVQWQYVMYFKISLQFWHCKCSLSCNAVSQRDVLLDFLKKKKPYMEVLCWFVCLWRSISPPYRRRDSARETFKESCTEVMIFSNVDQQVKPNSYMAINGHSYIRYYKLQRYCYNSIWRISTKNFQQLRFTTLLICNYAGLHNALNWLFRVYHACCTATAEIPHARLPLICISLLPLLSTQQISKILVGNFVHFVLVYTLPNIAIVVSV